MATPAQAAAATVGAGSLAAAGAYGVTQAVKGSGEETTEESGTTTETTEEVKEPESINVKTANTTYADKTLGHKEANKPLLVDYKHADNQKWWEWAYENIFKPRKDKTESNLNPIFKAVTKNYDSVPSSESGTDKKTSLNYACHYAYELKWYDFTSENHLLDNVKLFCTKGLTSLNVEEPEELEPASPKLLSDLTDADTTYKDKLGAGNGNKTKLIAPVGKDNVNNEDWWKWSYKKHFLAKKAENNKLDTHFSAVNKPYLATAESVSNQTSLNQACEKAYAKDLPINGDQTSTQNLKENITLFCAKATQPGTTTLTFTK